MNPENQYAGQAQPKGQPYNNETFTNSATYNQQAYAQDYEQQAYAQQYGQQYAQPQYEQQYAQPQYGAPQYGVPQGQPYGAYQNAYGYQAPYVVGTHSKIAAGLLGIFLGVWGVHNFYLGKNGKAVVQLLLGTVGILILVGPIISGFWGFIEGVLIIASTPGSSWHKDAVGYELID